jgi:hypothetical protein
LFFSLFVVVESRPLLLSQKTAGKEKEKKVVSVCVFVLGTVPLSVRTYVCVCVLCEGGGGRGVVSCGK